MTISEDRRTYELGLSETPGWIGAYLHLKAASDILGTLFCGS